MKLRRASLKNIRSFLEPAELLIDGDISIIIGPNGGGKTNLLDAISINLRRHVIPSWLPIRTTTPEIPDGIQFTKNDFIHNAQIERHSNAPHENSRIELDIEITASDLTNMAELQNSAAELTKLSQDRFSNISFINASKWNLSLLNEGKRVSYVIDGNSLHQTSDPGERCYREYLSQIDAQNHIRSVLGKKSLTMPMVSMPVTRTGSGFLSSLSLSGHQDHEYKKQVDGATSRSPGSIVGLAIGRLASRYRLLLEEDTGNAKKIFYEQSEIQSLSRVLKTLGYTWTLECTNALSNEYTVRLEKQGASFLVGAASSGEKELFTYLFAIYALNVRDALVIVDEPELHLHPRWQKILLKTFEDLSSETGNQFLLATHSPVFVSPSSIQFVSRVYSSNQQSRIIRLNNAQLPNQKHLFGIINSQNNERMFFADKVVLVEGITDRLVFDQVFRECGVYSDTTKLLEIIEVGGKGFFASYQKVLEACKVPYVLIADLDFVNEIGSPEIKALFTIDNRGIEHDVVKNPGSKDGVALAELLGAAIDSGNMDELKNLWAYIRERKRRVRSDLTTDEESLLGAFIVAERTKGRFILARGDLETYLPDGYRSKDLEKLLPLISSNFWESLDPKAKDEFQMISSSVMKF